MGTTADKLAYLQGTKAAIKSAIVNKGVAVPDGTTFRAYAEKIGSIVKVPSLSNPGSASDLRSGKQLAGADGSVITGTLTEVEQATPSISVSSGGLITVSATQSGGIVTAGSKSTTQQLTTQGAKTVTPGTTTQTAVASGRYTTGDVDVAGDANLKAENIAEGVSIFGVTGTHSGGLKSAGQYLGVYTQQTGKTVTKYLFNVTFTFDTGETYTTSILCKVPEDLRVDYESASPFGQFIFYGTFEPSPTAIYCNVTGDAYGAGLYVGEDFYELEDYSQEGFLHYATSATWEFFILEEE